MPQLLRLSRLCLYAAAIATLAMTAADAGGNGSLFSNSSALLAAPQSSDGRNVAPLLRQGRQTARNRSATPGNERVVPASAPAAVNARDLECLAEAIYFEARGESQQGQAAVAEVVLNRVDHRQFPSTVCGVVNQPAQFSYTIGGPKPIRNKSAYLRARDIAAKALTGAPRTLTGGATYFHTPAVRPAWARRFERTVKIGSHIFYRSGGQRIASN